MPDVTRSDSQRSDSSLRPRVSFNRDVHVKRIVPRESGRVVGALSGDGAGHLVTSPVRKERLNGSKKELAEEAARVLHQADKVDCFSNDKGVLPEKFYTLPNRRRTEYGSLGRQRHRRNSIESDEPPKKPPRSPNSKSNVKPSVFDIFKKTEKKPKKSNLRRSVSDAANVKSKIYGPETDQDRPDSDTEDNHRNVRNKKKQLSPIIEVNQREDYFSTPHDNNKENNANEENVGVKPPARKKWKQSESVTDVLRKYIDEVDEALFQETGVRITSPVEKIKEPEVVIIDLDKAEQISKTKNSKLKSTFGKKIKSLTNKRSKVDRDGESQLVIINNIQNVQTAVTNKTSPEKLKVRAKISKESISSPSPLIDKVIKQIEKNEKNSTNMIHSSQKPVDKLPLTKGRTVNTMVKRLSNDSSSPPPKTNVLVTPNVSVQHNGNQPFSYTRGLSPDKYMSNENSPTPGSPVIYAQVVCANGATGPSKQTVHTVYTSNIKKHPQHSDSDEGLGYEEHALFNKKYNHQESHFKNQLDDTRYRNFDKMNSDDYYNEVDKFEEEAPIMPKFRTTGYMNGFSGYNNKVIIDSSSRGRGDGMDAKRRESLSEPLENGLTPNRVNGSANINGRSDLSARRDLLESRINRRLTDQTVRTSPDEPRISPPFPNRNNLYVAEAKSKYHRNVSTSPVVFEEKYITESKTDKRGERYFTENRSQKFIDNNSERLHYDIRNKQNGFGYDTEPKSFESPISDYRSSPESRHFEASHNKSNDRYIAKSNKQKLFKDRSIYKSNPEINKRLIDDRHFEESYHDSLRRDKNNRIHSNTVYKTERYLGHNESDRKDKFVDSGIENDFRRDSGENFRVSRNKPITRDYGNDSEDEGFASSLLIASERQHTEEGAGNRKQRGNDNDYDRVYLREDESYRQEDAHDYKRSRHHEYVPRERSIDDGSHYDPRIDKEFERERGTLKKLDKKPPKPEKKSGLEKVKQLFSRDSKKKKEKQTMVREETLRARYKEYKGSTEDLEPKLKKREAHEVNTGYDYSNRRRLSTPSPSPTRELQRNVKPETTHGSWFKSLDRLSRKKNKKGEKEGNLTSTEDDISSKPTPTKNLRFFGDTDVESNNSIRHKPSFKSRSGPITKDRTRSQSTRDLHNISEELRSPELNVRKGGHKSMLNISEAERDGVRSKSNMKPPISPNHRAPIDIPRSKEDRSRRRKNEVSSVESSTEGDSSQQSQRSVVYLHAATVGDIPGPGYMRNGRRAASREELASNGSTRIQPQVKTLSRSFSVLAPWRPKHYRETMDIDYSQYPKPVKNGKYEQKISKNGTSRKDNSSTLKKKAHETRRSNQNMSTLSHKSKSKENVSTDTLKRSKEDPSKSSTSTLYKKKDRLPRENSRYTRERDDKKNSAKSVSVESLGNNIRSGRRSREDNRDISRSISMPRDPEKSAGWFKMTRKSNKKATSSQRL